MEGRISSKHLCRAQCSGINAYVLGQMQSTCLDENVSYNVYVHLNQRSGDLIYFKCSCKAGQGGCCKHVAALLFSLVDYSNLGYTVVRAVGMGGVGGITPPWKKFLSANSAPCRQTLRSFEKFCNLSANIAVCLSSSDFAK